MEPLHAVFYCENCSANLGLTGQSHLTHTDDGGQMWACEKKGKIRMESFDEAHRGRCPGCGIFDNGNHLTHRYGIITHTYGDGIETYHTTDGKRLTYLALESKRRAGFAFMRRDLAARGVAS